MKFCKDCKWYRKGGAPDLALCAKFPSLVDGRATDFCDIERRSEQNIACGPMAIYWEAAPPRTMKQSWLDKLLGATNA